MDEDQELALSTRCWCYDPDDEQFGWYWYLEAGGTRVNGGLAADLRDACRQADWRREAYEIERRRGWHD